MTHQTSQHLSAPLLFSFDELVQKLTSFLVWGVQGCCEYGCCNELKHSTLTSTRCFHPESWITGYFLLFRCKLFELAVWENPSSFGNTQTNLSDTNNHPTSKITQIDFLQQQPQSSLNVCLSSAVIRMTITKHYWLILEFSQ